MEQALAQAINPSQEQPAQDEGKTYFAALPVEKLLQQLTIKTDDYFNYLDRSGLYKRMRKSYNSYYGYSSKGRFSSVEISSGGKQGGLKLTKINHFRNLVQHVLNMTTSQRPALETRAANTDYASQAQTILGNGLLDFYMREKHLEKNLKRATENSLVLLEGYVELMWETSEGEPYMVDPDSQQVIYSGDIKYKVHSPLQVIRDVSVEDDNHDWYIVESTENKYDLAAKYPELAKRIIELEDDRENRKARINFITGEEKNKSDRIPVRKFLHRQTASMPEGRLVIYLNSEISLYDGPLPYIEMPGGLPLYKICPSSFIGSSFGYSSALDLLGIQDAIDALYSIIITNQTNFGVQNIIAPQGHNIEYTKMGEGLNLIEYNPTVGKPEALELVKTPQEIFNFIPQLESVMRLMIGLNDVVVGDPQASLKSGSALALVASQAIQFNSGLQQSWAELLENVGLATLKMLQQFAKTPRVAAIVGSHNRTYLRKFKGEDLSQITRVTVDVANPLSRTAAGRLEQANALLNAQAVSANQYMAVVETGKLEPITEGRTSHLMNIRAENEAMREGKRPPVIATDTHSQHIEEHRVVLDSPEARENPQLAQIVLEHINEHIIAMQTTHPAILAILDPNSLSLPQAPVQGGGSEGPTPMPEGPPPEKVADPTVNRKMPAQPNMPQNPLTGQRFNNSNGGM